MKFNRTHICCKCWKKFHNKTILVTEYLNWQCITREFCEQCHRIDYPECWPTTNPENVDFIELRKF